MRFVAYIMLLFSISLVLYFMGYAPIVSLFNEKGSFVLSMNCQTEDPYCTEQDSLIGAIFLVLLTAGLGSLLTGYSALYVIPMIILIAILNFFIFPLSFLMDAPVMLQVPTLAFFNILTVLAGINFIRGST